MTSEPMPPPLRAVFTPTDAADAAQALARQKSRWAHFLIARDAVLDATRGIWSRARKLVEKLGLTSVVQMARSGLGWLLKGLERTSEYLKAPGVRPGLLWALTTSTGQKVAGDLASNVGKAVGTAVRWTYRTLMGGLRRLGTPGQAVANWVEDLGIKAKRSVRRLRPVAETAQIVLSSDGLAARAVKAWARFRVLSAVLVRRLPRPWNLLGWLASVGVSVPSTVRAQAYRLLPDMTAAQSDEPDDPTPPPAAMRLVPPAVFSEAEPASVVGTFVSVDTPLVVNDVPHEPLEKSLQRHPAKRSPNARKRR